MGLKRVALPNTSFARIINHEQDLKICMYSIRHQNEHKVPLWFSQVVILSSPIGFMVISTRIIQGSFPVKLIDWLIDWPSATEVSPKVVKNIGDIACYQSMTNSKGVTVCIIHTTLDTLKAHGNP